MSYFFFLDLGGSTEPAKSPRSSLASPSDIQSNPRAIQVKPGYRLASFSLNKVGLLKHTDTLKNSTICILPSICILTPGLQAEVCILHQPHRKICLFTPHMKTAPSLLYHRKFQSCSKQILYVISPRPF